MLEKFNLSEYIINAITSCIKTIMTAMLKWFITNSFWLCLTYAMISLLLYVGGVRKAGKHCTISLLIYTITQSIGCVIQ